MSQLTRRCLIRGAVGITGALTIRSLTACSPEAAVGPTAKTVAEVEAARRRSGAALVRAQLKAAPVTLNLGGRVLTTWAYNQSVPGPLIRATAGDVLRVDLVNRLPAETSIHWHGVALRNDMDGVPGMTQVPIRAGESFRYEFTAPDPGTYFYHPHSGVQLDRGLYGVLVVDDPHEPGGYDEEWVVVLDDWVDGTGRTPDDVLTRLRTSGGTGDPGRMGGMDHGAMGDMMGRRMQSRLLGGAGDVDYPHFLVNGRTADAPVTLTGKPGQRIRVRFVNAGSDTAFRVAFGGHRMTLTHSDGFPVVPVSTDAVLIGMGERFDVSITLADGVFPLVASAEGKHGQGLAIVRTGTGRTPAAEVAVRELGRRVLLGTDLGVAAEARLPDRSTDRDHDLVLGGSMAPYRWTINGQEFPNADPLDVSQGERVRLRFANHSMMFHPMHLHGHTFALVGSGVRKDTVIVRPMQALEVYFDADNPGQWAAHCHNVYHAEAGMMTTLSYRA